MTRQTEKSVYSSSHAVTSRVSLSPKSHLSDLTLYVVDNIDAWTLNDAYQVLEEKQYKKLIPLFRFLLLADCCPESKCSTSALTSLRS